MGYLKKDSLVYNIFGIITRGGYSMMKKIFSVLLVAGLCISPINVLADEGDANQSEPQTINETDPYAGTKLPNEASNVTQVDNLYYGFYIPLNQSVTATYQVESTGNLNGEMINPVGHVVSQNVYWNGELVWSSSNGSYYTNQFTPTTIGSGYIETTWDNGNTEKDGIATLLWVIVNYYDVDTMEQIQDWKYITLTNTSFYTGVDGTYDGNSPVQWDASSLDKLDITGYKWVSSENIIGDISSVNLTKANGYYVYANVYYKKEFTVTYKDGVDDGEVFADQSTKALRNEVTPAFDGKSERDGYRFIGWSPEVEETVTEDAVYTAQWAKEYTITYTDGVDGEEVFKDQSTKALKDDKTPAFDGEPTRKGYKFMGWSPEVEETVTGDATYTAQWEKVGSSKDDKKSENNKKSNGTNTGAGNQLGVYICMMGMALTGMTAVFVEKKF